MLDEHEQERRRSAEETIPLDCREYAETLDWRSCRQYVEKAHGRGWDREEFVGGPIFREGEPFVLTKLSLNEIEPPGGYTTDSQVIEHYADLGPPFPPIVFSAQGHVIDGVHRLHAAFHAGCSTIQCYLPDEVEPEELNVYSG